MFLQKGEEEPWPERKYGKAPEAYKEVKSVKRGRIEAVYPGKDGVVRVVDVKKWWKCEAQTNYGTLTVGS